MNRDRQTLLAVLGMTACVTVLLLLLFGLVAPADHTTAPAGTTTTQPCVTTTTSRAITTTSQPCVTTTTARTPTTRRR